jgi:hypothetical protein
VAEKAIAELEEEILRQAPNGGPIWTVTLAIATSRLNSRLRREGLSARELWTQAHSEISSGNQLLATSYKVKTTDCLIVPNRSMSSTPYPRRDRDNSDEEECEECPYQTSNVPSTLTTPADNSTSPTTTQRPQRKRQSPDYCGY